MGAAASRGAHREPQRTAFLKKYSLVPVQRRHLRRARRGFALAMSDGTGHASCRISWLARGRPHTRIS
jgi:hypothetical protein